MKIKVGTYAVECPKCKDAMLVMRIGRMDAISKVARCTCRCSTCNVTRQVEQQIEKVKVERKKKTKRKGPVVRTYAGLKGTRVSKREWTFKYPTNEYGPLWLKTTKNTWNNWSVWWAAERVASGDTIKEALEKAKKRLDDRGYHLV